MRLILLPGMDGTGQLFSPLRHALAECGHEIQARVIPYPQACLSYAELTDYVQAQLPAQEAFIVLAESFSGPVAYQLARRAIPNMRAMILVASFLRNPNPDLLWLSRILPLSVLLRFSPPDQIIKKWMLGDKASDEQLREFKSVLKSVPNKVIIFRLAQIARLSLNLQTINLETISLPVYYLQAVNDRLVDKNNIHDVQRVSPDLKSIEMDGPHFILQTKPRECARYITEQVRLLIDKC